jgi:tetratricopeptide (TPR) repeat protein
VVAVLSLSAPAWGKKVNPKTVDAEVLASARSVAVAGADFDRLLGFVERCARAGLVAEVRAVLPELEKRVPDGRWTDLAGVYAVLGDAAKVEDIAARFGSTPKTDQQIAAATDDLCDLVVAFERLGQPDQARKHFERIIDDDGTSFDSCAAHAASELARDGNIERAVVWAERVGAPLFLADAWLSVGRAHIAAGDEAAGRKALDRALAAAQKKSSEQGETFARLAAAYGDAGDGEKALRWARKAFELMGVESKHSFDLSHAGDLIRGFKHGGDQEKVEWLLRRIARMGENFDSASSLAQAGLHCWDYGDRDRARELFGKAEGLLVQQAKDDYARRILVQARLRAGELSPALQQVAPIQEAELYLDAAFDVIAYCRGQTCERTKGVEAALKTLRR